MKKSIIPQRSKTKAFFPNDDDISDSIVRYVDRHGIHTSASILCIFIVIGYELTRFISLPITNKSIGSIGIAPLIMSSMIHGVATVEFRFKDENGSKLKSDLTLTLIYVAIWYSNETLFTIVECLDALLLLVFTLIIRYVDLVVSGLSTRWISLIHSTICIHSVYDLSNRVALGEGVDIAAIGIGFATTMYLIRNGTRSIPFSYTKLKNNSNSHPIPWFYNGSTSLIYADTYGAAIDALMRTLLTGNTAAPLWLFSIIYKSFLIAFFETKLPIMQGRNAKVIIESMQTRAYTMQGWRQNSNAERHLDRLIDKSWHKRVVFMILMKCFDLSGILILVEQLKSVRFANMGKSAKRQISDVYKNR